MISLPKAAAELLELAESREWKTGTQHGEDSGGSPFVTIAIGRKFADGTIFYYKITWHTRNTGTYRLFGKIARTPTSPGWHDAPSLREIQRVVEAH